MSATAKAGLMLVILGVMALLFATMKFKSKEEIFRVGDFRASATTEKRVPELGYAGGGLVGVGGLLLIVGSRKSRRR